MLPTIVALLLIQRVRVARVSRALHALGYNRAKVKRIIWEVANKLD